MAQLLPAAHSFGLHWGEMGTRWGVNRTVAHRHAPPFPSPESLDAAACHYRMASWQTPVLWFCRSAVAATWLYNGLWLKLLDESGHHALIVAEASGLSPALAYVLTAVIGVLECSLAFAVMSGRRPWFVCGVQVLSLACMNTAGMLGAGDLIENAPDLMVRNFSFFALVLAVALLGDRHAKSR